MPSATAGSQQAPSLPIVVERPIYSTPPPGAIVYLGPRRGAAAGNHYQSPKWLPFVTTVTPLGCTNYLAENPGCDFLGYAFSLDRPTRGLASVPGNVE